MRSVNFVSDFLGCGYYRFLWPAQAVNTSDTTVVTDGIECTKSMIVDPQVFYRGMKAIRLQRCSNETTLLFIRDFLTKISKKQKTQLIVDHDDWLFDIPEYNQARYGFNRDVLMRAAQIIKNVSYNTVSTSYLKKMMVKHLGADENKIMVSPNRLPRHLFGYNDAIIENRRKNFKRKPKILWSGSKTHIDIYNKTGYRDDIEDLRPLMAKLGNKVSWVFMGSSEKGSEKANLPKGLDIEYIPWCTILNYPRILANLDVDMAIITLQDNDFNRSKSNIKLLEFAACGIPTVFTDVEPYKFAPCKYDPKNVDHLEDQVKRIIKDKKYRSNVVDSQLSFVNDNGFWTDDPKAINEYINIADGNIKEFIKIKANEDIV